MTFSNSHRYQILQRCNYIHSKINRLKIHCVLSSQKNKYECNNHIAPCLKENLFALTHYVPVPLFQITFWAKIFKTISKNWCLNISRNSSTLSHSQLMPQSLECITINQASRHLFNRSMSSALSTFNIPNWLRCLSTNYKCYNNKNNKNWHIVMCKVNWLNAKALQV